MSSFLIIEITELNVFLNIYLLIYHDAHWYNNSLVLLLGAS